MTTATAQPRTASFTASPAHSSFQATLRHMGVGSFRTSFDDVEASLEPTPEGHRLRGRALVRSIDIRRPAEFRAHVVEGPEFFDAGRHPELQFVADHLRLTADGPVTVDGVLTMRGIARPVSATGTFRAPVEDIFGSARAALDLTATIDRRDWGMNFQARLPGGGDALSWEVEVSVYLELVRDA